MSTQATPTMPVPHVCGYCIHWDMGQCRGLPAVMRHWFSRDETFRVGIFRRRKVTVSGASHRERDYFETRATDGCALWKFSPKRLEGEES